MITRSYRVILEVDVELEFDEEPNWEDIESHLENRDGWGAYLDAEYAGAYTYINHAQVDSFDVGWE